MPTTSYCRDEAKGSLGQSTRARYHGGQSHTEAGYFSKDRVLAGKVLVRAEYIHIDHSVPPVHHPHPPHLPVAKSFCEHSPLGEPLSLFNNDSIMIIGS